MVEVVLSCLSFTSFPSLSIISLSGLCCFFQIIFCAESDFFDFFNYLFFSHIF